MKICHKMSLFTVFLYFVFLLNPSSVSTNDVSYADHFKTMGLRIKTELQKPSQILNSQQVFEDLEKLLANRRTLLSHAHTYLSENNLGVTSDSVSYNVSELCLNHTEIILGALFRRKPENWAERMLDAMGKLPSNVMSGRLAWFGSYDECVEIRALIQHNDTGTLVQESPFQGQYCQLGIPIAPIDPNNPMTALFSSIRIGMCFPDSCSLSDAVALANTVLSFVPLGNTSIHVSENPLLSHCEENNLQYDTKAIAVLVVCGFFIAILVIATLYDIVFVQLPKHNLLSKDKEIPNGDAVTQVERTLNQDEYKPLLGERQSFKSSDDGPGIVAELLLSFSMYTNGKKLLNTKQPPGSLKCVHGIRFLSMSWVILGHSVAFGLQNGDNLASYLQVTIEKWTFQAIANALVSVDSFFTLSGLLMSYLVLKEMKKNNGKLNWPMYYFHRFWRLTPPYMLVMMVYVPLFPYFSNGPVWAQQGLDSANCAKSWWTNLLYINNFVNLDAGCFAWAWYLANDMQFYIISPLLFVPLFYSEIIGVIVCLVALLAVSITSGVISTVHHLPASMLGGGPVADSPNAYFNDYYIKPYCRMGPYIIGILTGYILYKTNCQVRLNKYVNLVGWLIAAACALAVLYGLYDPMNGRNILNQEVSSLYNATHRTVWGACLCWVIFTCVTGNGGPVNIILSWSGMVPLSRLTYCAYLVHPIIMYIYYMSLRYPLYFTDLTLVWIFLGNLVVSYGVAFIVSLAFESPMMGLEKVIFKREDKRNVS